MSDEKKFCRKCERCHLYGLTNDQHCDFYGEPNGCNHPNGGYPYGKEPKEKKYHYEVRFYRRGKQVGKSKIVETLEEARLAAHNLCDENEKASIYRCEVKDWKYYDGK